VIITAEKEQPLHSITYATACRSFSSVLHHSGCLSGRESSLAGSVTGVLVLAAPDLIAALGMSACVRQVVTTGQLCYIRTTPETIAIAHPQRPVSLACCRRRAAGTSLPLLAIALSSIFVYDDHCEIASLASLQQHWQAGLCRDRHNRQHGRCHSRPTVQRNALKSGFAT
jgi:hypothetical protein